MLAWLGRPLAPGSGCKPAILAGLTTSLPHAHGLTLTASLPGGPACRPGRIAGRFRGSRLGFMQPVSMPPSVVALPSAPLAAPLMTLPPWAYRQRQELSPIQLEGVVEAVRCSRLHCLVALRVSTVQRNTTASPIQVGDRIQIEAIPQHTASQVPAGSAPPSSIGAPQAGVRIPRIGAHTAAWLRPSPQHAGAFELLAGPYGFGPDLLLDPHP
jgi:hypothetical protein